MRELDDIRYACAIRTRRAELVGLGHVVNAYDRGLLPIFELTRSRRSRSNPEGSVDVSVEQILEECGENIFVVDITSLESLSNSQIDKLLEPDDDFGNWREFVRTKLPDHAIPVVHLLDPFDAYATQTQIDEFLHRQSAVALRVPADFVELEELAKVLDAYQGSGQRFAFFADAGLVLPKGYPGAVARVNEVLAHLEDFSPGLFASLASSFPSSVTQLGGDSDGQFTLQEVRLSLQVQDEAEDLRIVHGDYACIHPVDMEGMAINWVPRVDVPLDETLFYHRYRRGDGGYIRAAAAALQDARYVALQSWAHDNIVEAANGSPQGKAPAHWISVRLNYHIERQLLRLM